VPLREQPGTRFTYGNGTDLLGAVIETVTGKRLGTFLQDKVFSPLGMKDTAFQAVDPQRLTAAYAGQSAREQTPILDTGNITSLGDNRLTLVDAPANSPFARTRGIDFGGAGLVSTISDYLAFARMLAAGGAASGARILSPASVALMSANALPDEALATPGLQTLGLGFGLGAACYVNPAKVPAGIPPGVFFWGGAASTFFWADPANQIGGCIMAQVFGGDFRAYHLAMIQAFYRALG
jgi:CubicO group peptidase (beta-lactamase class C family)